VWWLNALPVMYHESEDGQEDLPGIWSCAVGEFKCSPYTVISKKYQLSVRSINSSQVAQPTNRSFDIEDRMLLQQTSRSDDDRYNI
jgi:hypothetical protein